MNFEENQNEEERGLIDKLLGFINKVCVLIFIVLLLMVGYQKIAKHNFKVGDYRVITIQSDTMKPHYKDGDIVIVKSVDQSELIVGDDIAYRSGGLRKNAKLMFERIVDIVTYEEDSKVEFIVNCTKCEDEPKTVGEDQIYGKLIYKTYVLGYLGKFANQPITFVLLIVIPVVLFVIFKLRGILRDFKEKRREKKLVSILEDDLDNDNDDDDDDDEESKEIIKKYYE